MLMVMSFYEGVRHGKIGSEGMQQEECPLVRILLRGNQAREDSNERESQTGGIPLHEAAHRGEYVLELLSHTQYGNE
jgi:hypothetical protein